MDALLYGTDSVAEAMTLSKELSENLERVGYILRNGHPIVSI